MDHSMLLEMVRILGERVAQHEGFIERKLGGIPEPEPDYEAMGYPETRVLRTMDLDSHVGMLTHVLMATRRSSTWGYPTDKEYP